MIYLPSSIGCCLSRGTGSWCWFEKTQDLNHCHFPTPVKKKKLFQTPSITQIVSNYSVLEVNVRNHLHDTIYPIIWQWYWMLLETFWSSKVKYANNKGIQIYSIFVNFVTCLETQRPTLKCTYIKAVQEEGEVGLDDLPDGLGTLLLVLIVQLGPRCLNWKTTTD